MLRKFSIPLSLDGMICAEKIRGTFVGNLDSSWEILSLEPFKRLIRICFGMVTFPGIILLIERAVYWFACGKESKKRGRRRKL